MQVLRNTWYVAAWPDEIGSDTLLGRTILNQPVLMFRKGDGTPAAIGDRCPHRFAPTRGLDLALGLRRSYEYEGSEGGNSQPSDTSCEHPTLSLENGALILGCAESEVKSGTSRRVSGAEWTSPRTLCEYPCEETSNGNRTW